MEKVPPPKKKAVPQECEATILKKANAIVLKQQQDRIDGFRAEYKELTEKWGVAIGGRPVFLEGGRVGVELAPRPINQ